MNSVDIIFNDDVEISGGDLLVGPSDDQHVRHIILANPGQYYQYPEIGYGVTRKMNATIDIATEKKLLKQQLELDNYSMPSDGIVIDPVTGKFEINRYIKKS